MRMNLRTAAKTSLSIGILALLMLITIPAHSTTITVPGTSDPWLAGMPTGTLSNVGTPEPPDVAPNQSPVQALHVVPGTVLRWSATGLVGHPSDIADPDGASVYSHATGTEHGISNIYAPIDSLLGVFIGSSVDQTLTPGTLNFSTQASRDYAILNPSLQQVFFMGNGLTSLSIVQEIVVPAGATWLYLGTMDGYGWANNVGSFEVTINPVPEPATMLLLGSGLIGLVGFRKKFKKA